MLEVTRWGDDALQGETGAENRRTERNTRCRENLGLNVLINTGI